MSHRRYLDHLQLRGLRPGTIDYKRRQLARIERDLTVPLLDATPEQLAAWYDRTARRISDEARANDLSGVRSYYRWAIDRDLITVDPSRKLPMPRIPRRLPRPIAEDDLGLALANATERVRPILVLAAWQGLRACEIARLRREDVLDGQPEPVLVVVEGKGGHPRVIPLHPLIVPAITHLPNRGHLFTYRNGRAGHLPPHMISRLANDHLRACGIRSSLHTLRHRYATGLYRISHDLRLVQDVLGHASVSTTAKYAAWHRPDAVTAIAQLPTLSPVPALPFSGPAVLREAQ